MASKKMPASPATTIQIPISCNAVMLRSDFSSRSNMDGITKYDSVVGYSAMAHAGLICSNVPVNRRLNAFTFSIFVLINEY